jgi:2,3-bisphosphoglycerate-independent phosphoglycerate mutase
MVGHTGSIPEAIAACEASDRALGVVLDAVARAGGVTLVTADHGNAETMLEVDGVSPHTAHTTNPVPFVSRPRGPRCGTASCPISRRRSCCALGIPLPPEYDGIHARKAS